MGSKEGTTVELVEQDASLAVIVLICGTALLVAIPWVMDFWDVYVRNKEPMLEIMKRKWFERQ